MSGLCEHGYEHGYGGWVHTAEGWKPLNYPYRHYGPIPLPWPLHVRIWLAVKRFLDHRA